MRTLFGFILGIAFTVGVAYVRDTQVVGPAVKPLVNWEEVADSSRTVVDSVRAQWERWTR